jgi:hypothetical protein
MSTIMVGRFYLEEETQNKSGIIGVLGVTYPWRMSLHA